jgi:hypothetical protein
VIPTLHPIRASPSPLFVPEDGIRFAQACQQARNNGLLAAIRARIDNIALNAISREEMKPWIKR